MLEAILIIVALIGAWGSYVLGRRRGYRRGHDRGRLQGRDEVHKLVHLERALNDVLMPFHPRSCWTRRYPAARTEEE